MAIILCLGNVGSGKTASIVREMVLNEQGIKFYTNINPIRKDTPWIVKIKPEMIIGKDLLGVKKKQKTGVEVPIYDFKLNKEFWQEIKEPISVVLDEVHTIMNPRRSNQASA